MFVGLKMLRDFETVTPQTLVKDAQKILEESKLWMLLVEDGDELVGYVRKEDITGALPSMVTSLEKHEISFLMSKLTIAEILRTDIKKISPETEIEAAADMMHEMNLAGLAVVNENDSLIGYINRSVMLDVLVEGMGYREGGSRVAVVVEDRPGMLYEAAGIIANLKYSIISASTFLSGDSRLLVFRIAADDTAPVVEALAGRGFKLVDSEDFQENWQ